MNQLALPLTLADHAVFGSFWPQGNEPLVAFLEDLADGSGGPGCWLWGARATGKSHLLQATCERAGDAAIYLPLGLLLDAGPAMLDGVAARSVVCIDDVDRAAGLENWEYALFGLCNQLLDLGGSLVCSAVAAPRDCGMRLADLQSRFSQLPTFRVAVLAEPARIEALKLRARHRGLELPDETARFMLGRARRDMASLYRLLDRLDAAALQAQRRLTVPFVRDVLGQ